MRVKLNTIMAVPKFSANPGDVIDVTAAEAKALIDGRYADAADEHSSSGGRAGKAKAKADADAKAEAERVAAEAKAKADADAEAEAERAAAVAKAKADADAEAEADKKAK